MKVKTVIFCGGQGTRIRGVADDLPKPMVLIGNRPVLWHIMKLYAHYSIEDFVLCLGYKGWEIKEFFLNYRAFSADVLVTLGNHGAAQFFGDGADPWRVWLAETGEYTQTGGRLGRVRQYLQDSDLFCVTYGDGIADIDIQSLLEFHRRHGRIGTVTGVRPPGRFGIMRVASQTRSSIPQVLEFQEKAQVQEGWVNGGFFVFDHRLWDYVTTDENLVFEHEPLARLAEDGQLVMYEHAGFWQPMDTYREWKLLNELWAQGSAPWKVW